MGLELAQLEGSGPGGRIVKADVEAAAKGEEEAPPAEERKQEEPKTEPAPVISGEADTGRGETEIQELSRLQRTVARRMAESKATAPEFVLTVEVDMEAAVEVREPTIFDADQKSLGTIARETRTVAERVRAGKITPPELSSGTFTVSNLGMFGIDDFVAVINPPQAAILAVGAMKPTPVARDGEVVVRAIMRMTLVCDHRILYGADAAQFLGRIRERLENPFSLAL